MKDDWDLVSLPAEEDAAWNAVSIPAPQEPPDSPPRQSSPPDTFMATRQEVIAPPHMQAPALRKTVPFIALALLLVLGSFGGFLAVSRHAITFPATANIPATATAGAGATVIANPARATATAQAVATATAAQQIYTQATSGTPVFSDPLSDDTNNWGVLSTNWGGSCAFTGGAYHLALSQPHYWLWCVCASTSNNLNNFVFQVQVNIVRGNDGGIVFSPAQGDYYKAYVTTGTSAQGTPGGLYLLYRQEGSGYHTLRYGFSRAILTGPNQTNVVTIIVDNGSFYFYDNGQFLISDSVNAFSNGSAGVSAQSDSQATDVIFSNVKIWSVP